MTDIEQLSMSKKMIYFLKNLLNVGNEIPNKCLDIICQSVYPIALLIM